MTPEAKKNILEAFAANPSIDEFFTNEHGHCFTKPANDLKAVRRQEAEGWETEKKDGAEVGESKKAGSRKK